MTARLEQLPLNLSVAQAANELGIGTTKIQHLINDGSLRSVKIGVRRLIPAQAIVDFLDQQSNGKGDE